MANGEETSCVRWPALIALLSILLLIQTSAIGWLASMIADTEGRTDMAMAAAMKAEMTALSARPDPFTGSMGRRMESALIDRDRAVIETLRRECELTAGKIEARFRAVEKEIDKCHTYFKQHERGSQ